MRDCRKENFFLPDICNFSPIAIVLKKEGYGSYFIEIGYMIKAEDPDFAELEHQS